MIKAIVIPTPKRLRKYIRESDFKKKAKTFATPERAMIYGTIGTGITVISLSDVPAKPFVIGSLIYHGIAYEILERWYDEYGNDEEIRKMMMSNKDYWNNFYMRF
ncbi:hypothetical protein [Clostridium sp. LIBA-8841]|uniref:hypothetical protein n=1 Tax=Clostridium sp. LIBA-8841 TaxID=2987530 RepID=UPI002AC4CEBF|nr:hypothetical protein [Clostridium sp. LIBA-8841]MDZ5254736.1 hypothetical protein [Clostridium sp. LIBA-8841]